MDFLHRTVKKEWGIIILSIIVPFMTVSGQSDANHSPADQSLTFSINGETHRSNAKKPTLMLDIVEQMESNPHLVHLNVDYDQILSDQKDGKETLSVTSLEAEFKFAEYNTFRSWFDSDDTQNMIDKLKEQFRDMHMQLQLDKKVGHNKQITVVVNNSKTVKLNSETVPIADFKSKFSALVKDPAETKVHFKVEENTSKETISKIQGIIRDQKINSIRYTTIK